MTKVMVIAPHPDDETLGCGGTLLKEGAAGHSLHWVIVTDMSGNRSYSQEQRTRRDDEIRVVSERYGFSSVVQLGHPTTRLDIVPRADLVGSLRGAIDVVKPDELYVPFRGDMHSDHRKAYCV
jgi:LmbE family N-acetylglucosaminyl deacetylase